MMWGKPARNSLSIRFDMISSGLGMFIYHAQHVASKIVFSGVERTWVGALFIWNSYNLTSF